jgi:uncharacterized protein with PQ loop repeat
MANIIHIKHLYEKENNKKKKARSNKIIDNLSIVAAILMPFTTIPQIYKIWILQNTSGVSILTWILYTVLCFPMLIYGLYYKMTPIIILNILWIIMNLIMIIGLIVF